MKFGTYFRLSSYSMVACGAATLALAGGLNWFLFAGFILLMVLAWRLESTKWQLSERLGLILVLLALPVFYIEWKLRSTYLAGSELGLGVGALAHLMLLLSAVKLLQKKVDRDWVFLYLISFFAVLLAAGLSTSPLFLVSVIVYVFLAVSTIIALEIRKSRRVILNTQTRLLIPSDHGWLKLSKRRLASRYLESRRLPFASANLLLLIVALAVPIFFIVPRTGASSFTRSRGGPAGLIGFSERVTLGDIGRLKQNTEVVMRARVENPESVRDLRWRGVALDSFDGRGWRRSSRANSYIEHRSNRNFFQLGTAEAVQHLTVQTIFLEPIDTPTLFGAPRVVAINGSFPYIRQDSEDALSSRHHDYERITYKAISDTSKPAVDLLRRDFDPYPGQYARYLELPNTLDPRIRELAGSILREAGARNRYDAAVALENYFQNEKNFGYTLEMQASGSDPLSDFLFRVREGHCEYFATAMAVMLRTQGIASRLVNGFLRGRYNDAADVFTVTQSDAHSWVEIYFPQTDTWMTFDPTPAAGRQVSQSTGLGGRLSKYAEAIEMFWMQYVVGFNKQEQRDLLVSVRRKAAESQRSLSLLASRLSSQIETFIETRGTSLATALTGRRIWAAAAMSVLFLGLAGFLVLKFPSFNPFNTRHRRDSTASGIEFYERMTQALATRGYVRPPEQTPLEFAERTGIAEALQITQMYNRVRFGEKDLDAEETTNVEEWLNNVEGGES